MTGNEFATYSLDGANRITGITQSLWASRALTQVISRQGQYIKAEPSGMGGGSNRFDYADGDVIDGFDPYRLAACQLAFPNMSIDTGLGFNSTNVKGHGGILTYGVSGGFIFWSLDSR